MASQDYLIAIALIEQNNERAMPLGGKEIKLDINDKDNFKKLSEDVILNLYLDYFKEAMMELLKDYLQREDSYLFTCILKECRRNYLLSNQNG